MPNNYVSDPASFLIETLFGLYITIVALRIIMQWAQWEYHNQFVQVIIKITQIPVKFLRRFIPAIGRWDSATIFLLSSLTIVKIVLLALLHADTINLIHILRFSAADIVSLFITLFTASIIIQAILSWISPHSSHPITPLLFKMNAPLLRPVRKWLPAMSGLDLSPPIVIIGLHLVSLLVVPLLITL